MDFKISPELIPDTLEDFHPWRASQPAQLFYDLIRWLNGPESELESNDCAFDGPRPNTSQQVHHERPYTLQATGRLMVFYRRLELNAELSVVNWLTGAIEDHLRLVDLKWDGCVVSIATMPTRYIDLPNQDVGSEVCLNWWVWGDNEEQVLDALGRMSVNLLEVFKNVVDDMQHPPAS